MAIRNGTLSDSHANNDSNLHSHIDGTVSDTAQLNDSPERSIAHSHSGEVASSNNNEDSLLHPYINGTASGSLQQNDSLETSDVNGHSGEVAHSNNDDSQLHPHINGTISDIPQRDESPKKSVTNGHLAKAASQKLCPFSSKLIAICGMAIRLPAGIDNTQQFWNFLLSKGDARSRVPESRYNISAYHSKTSKPGTIKTEYGYFLEGDLGDLDAGFFNMTRRELVNIDPQQRKLLEIVRECFESAGEADWRGKDIGCYIGSFGEDWAEIVFKESQPYGTYRIAGHGDFALSNRISYEYDLKGPSMTIRTGCSSSLICVHEACKAILSGECSSAIVGGANLIMAPGMTAAMTEQGVLSPDGSCKTFDADANGYGRGEAINAIFIKPLDDAMRDGNPIRAVIRATSTNCDGRTPGLSMPSLESHEAMMRRAYRVADIDDFSQTAYVECHGTGTAIGDPLETEAVANIFGDHGVYIGSVKPNVGHSEGSSGITSLIKAVLALENKTIPPQIKFNKPNPKIPFKERKLTVPIEPISWPQDRLERVSVNSFGIGGANAHVIIDSAASMGLTQNQRTDAPQPQLLVFSANTETSLRQHIVNHQQYLKSHADLVEDLAYTLSVRREHLSHRAFTVFGDGVELTASALTKTMPSPELVFVLTGQGAQAPMMGSELFHSNPIYRQSILSMDQALQMLPKPPNWLLVDELLKPENLSRVDEPEFSQPLCTAVQIALLDCLASVKIYPCAVVGHSSGEIAGAYAVGALTAAEAIIVAYYRGYAASHQTLPGAMAAIGLGWDAVDQFLVPGVVVACENSPSSVTISGDTDKLDEVIQTIKQKHPDVFARRLKVGMAYHSHHMKTVGPLYCGLLEGKIFADTPNKPFFSSVTGRLEDSVGALGPQYWQQNLESPVLFQTALKALLTTLPQPKFFVEVGPHSALSGPLRQVLSNIGRPFIYTSALIRGKDARETYLAALGHVYINGGSVDLKALCPQGSVLTDVPSYPWDHSVSYWAESRLSKDWRARKFPHHDLLGIRVVESSDFEPSWRNLLHLDNAPWIRDHMLGNDIVFPFAGYVGMIGEAIFQLTGEAAGFSLRHVNISAALVLTEEKPSEIMATLKRHPLTDSLDSQWWDFTIVSYTGSTWIKHCVGQARAESHPTSTGIIPKALPREISPSKWYGIFRQRGLNYGPAFQGLHSISCDTLEHHAVGLSRKKLDIGGYSDFAMHPTMVDHFLQLFSVADAKGIPRNMGTMAVPRSVDELTLFHCGPEMMMTVSASSTIKGDLVGQGDCVADGKLVLQMRGVKLVPLEEELVEESDTHAGARMEWRPDIDFLDPHEIIATRGDGEPDLPLLEEFTLLLTVETHLRLQSQSASEAYLEKFYSWLGEWAAMAKNSVVAAEMRNMTQTDREIRISKILGQLLGTSFRPVVVGMVKILETCETIFQGIVNPLDVLLSDGTLTELYDWMDDGLGLEYVQLLGHNKPNLRVLEIGAGTGGTTNKVLSALASTNGSPTYSLYKYTDISAGFFVAAKDRFKQHSNIEFATLDISKDPLDQGFTEGSYDLIIATNVLHATPVLSETLANVRKLLSAQGRLILQELCAECKAINYIMGVLPGWWLGEADDRPSEPFVSPDRWVDELRRTGFRRPDVIVLDSPAPHQRYAVIVVQPDNQIVLTKDVTLLCLEKTPFSDTVHQALVDDGYTTNICQLNDGLPPGRDIIAILDIDKPFFEKLSADRLKSFQFFLAKLEGRGVLWLTRPSQIGCTDPRYALSIGAARTIRSDLAIDFATCELDNIETCPQQVVKLFEKFTARRQDDLLQADMEYAVHKGIIHIGRYYPTSINDELVANVSDAVKCLDIGKFGRLSTLHWIGQTRAEALVGEEVEIETSAASMNFKDVLIAMGIVDGGQQGLGIECAGTVSRIGPSVTGIDVGDRVMAFATGCFATVVKTTASLCVKIPTSLTFTDAATMPVVYGTVIMSLCDVGNLQRGQSVLIHSACGGVGIAAMQVSQMIGAEIFATVGSEEKVQYLMSTFGLRRDHIFNSRDASFLPEVLKATGGNGVDLVLNSLSGELLHASWKCVAEFGKMVEIGKRDLIGFGKLDMSVFEDNRSYCGVDLGGIILRRAALSHRLLEKVVELYETGHIQPIRPIKTFAAAEIQECFRYMQKGQHLGKIVVDLASWSDGLEAEHTPRNLTLDPTASYLLIGGLGGLGKTVSTWMVECGARHLIYLSRSAGKSEQDQSFFKELASQGCQVQTLVGSVSCADDVQKAIGMAKGSLKGVLQMSMVLKDQQCLHMTHDEWVIATEPKVEGTWNLHNATKGMQLDFFVLFSSISGIVGQPGQMNYAAANAFLDAFVQYRRSLHLTVSTIDIGVVEDAGYVSQTPALLAKLKATGAYAVREGDLLDALKVAIIGPKPSGTSDLTCKHQTAIAMRSSIPLNDPNNRLPWKRDLRMAVYHNFSADAGASEKAVNNELKMFLQMASANPDILKEKPNIDLLAMEIGRRLLDFMISSDEVDITKSLADYGMDSLVAIEMRNWWRQTFRTEISVLEMLAKGSILELGELCAHGLYEKLQQKEVQSEDPNHLAMKAP